MTSERRAYVIVFALTIGSAATAASMVTAWTISSACQVIAAATAAFVAGMAKSPRDGALSDQASPPVTDAVVKIETQTTSHSEAVAPDPGKPTLE